MRQPNNLPEQPNNLPERGTLIEGFNGRTVVYIRLTRNATPSKSAKVSVIEVWPDGKLHEREYYAECFPKLFKDRPLPPPREEDGYYFITPEEGGWRDIEAMWLAEDARNDERNDMEAMWMARDKQRGRKGLYDG